MNPAFATAALVAWVAVASTVPAPQPTSTAEQPGSQGQAGGQSAVIVVESSTKDQPNPLRATAPEKSDTDAARIHRWLDLHVAYVETRYKFVSTSEGVTVANQWQHKESLGAAFKFDAKGRYTIQSFLGTGDSFVGSWDPTGVGTGDPTWNFRVRRLYAQAMPVKGLELAAGSFDVLRGETTEIVSYDNDAFMQGYRASVKRPRQFYFDEISVTAGYLGDVTTANVFRRFKWMNDHNYSQALVAKKVATLVSASMDWTSLAGVSTLREGMKLTTTSWGHVIDALHGELYQRTEGVTGHGFAFTADRTLTSRVAAKGGFTNIDPSNGVLNGDRYAHGKHVFAGGRVAILPELTASVFYAHAVDNHFPVPNNQRFDVVLAYDVVKALQQHKAW